VRVDAVFRFFPLFSAFLLFSAVFYQIEISYDINELERKECQKALFYVEKSPKIRFSTVFYQKMAEKCDIFGKFGE